jgi:superfamily II DNA or RNA helicase
MAAQFQRAGIASAAVYAGSALGRTQALEQLRDGQLSVVFSVDLFNEGVDLPGIDQDRFSVNDKEGRVPLTDIKEIHR